MRRICAYCNKKRYIEYLTDIPIDVFKIIDSNRNYVCLFSVSRVISSPKCYENLLKENIKEISSKLETLTSHLAALEQNNSR